MPEKLLKCAIINDLSGYGRCSLTVAMPILAALGIQPCPIPTAVLSNHTDYDNYFIKDFTEHMPEYIENWRKLKLEFDAIYTGFLGSAQQVEIIKGFIRSFKKADTLLFVDPVMGDNGKLYATYNKSLCDEMKRLVGIADVISPNLTEACILSDMEYLYNPGDKYVYDIAETLADKGVSTVVITGIRRGEKIANFVVDKKKNERFFIESDFVGSTYCGTGDVFSSLLCGYLLKRVPNREALSMTSEFVKNVTAFSRENSVSPRDGIAFEPLLHNIIK